MSSQTTQIPNRQVHDTIVAESESKPTVIYVSNSVLPACKAFTPKYESIADKHNNGNTGKQAIKFCQLEITSETSAMFKFSPNQLPVVVFMCKGPWSKTLMSPTVKEFEDGIKELLERSTELRN